MTSDPLPALPSPKSHCQLATCPSGSRESVPSKRTSSGPGPLRTAGSASAMGDRFVPPAVNAAIEVR